MERNVRKVEPHLAPEAALLDGLAKAAIASRQLGRLALLDLRGAEEEEPHLAPMASLLADLRGGLHLIPGLQPRGGLHLILREHGGRGREGNEERLDEHRGRSLMSR